MNGFHHKYNRQKLKKIGQKMKQEARDEELNKDSEHKSKIVTTNFQGEPIYVQEVDAARLPRPFQLKGRVVRTQRPPQKATKVTKTAEVEEPLKLPSAVIQPFKRKFDH